MIRPHADEPVIYGVRETPYARAWRPLLDWLAAQGIDPTHLVRVEIDPEAGTATTTDYRLDKRGRRTYRESTLELEYAKPKVRRLPEPLLAVPIHPNHPHAPKEQQL